MRVLLLFLLLLTTAWATPAEVVQGNNQFAKELYQQLSRSQGNLFYSPFSLSSALSMTAQGARGQTLHEMNQVLHAQGGPQDWGLLLNDLLAPQPHYQFHLANRIWPSEGFRLKSEFLDGLQKYFLSSVQSLNFKESERARKIINDWVAEQTRQRILNLIPGGVLDLRTRLVLTNAIYFKGAWQTPFNPRFTRPAPFSDAAGRQAECQMMHNTAHYLYGEVTGVQVLEMPYAGERLTMTVLLPRDAAALARLEKDPDWQRYATGLAPTPVELSFPRCKLEGEFTLNDTLKAMGMVEVFDPNLSDLSGIADGEILYISRVVHKAFIEVNEEGSEAAAATAVVVTTRSAGAPPVPFQADHTFLFAIRDLKTGSVLFSGRVDRP